MKLNFLKIICLGHTFTLNCFDEPNGGNGAPRKELVDGCPRESAVVHPMRPARLLSWVVAPICGKMYLFHAWCNVSRKRTYLDSSGLPDAKDKVRASLWDSSDSLNYSHYTTHCAYCGERL